MLLLVTIGLVLVGAVALVIGFVTNSLGPIYLSIACSIIAGAVLVVFSRMSRKQVTATATGPAPLAHAGDVVREVTAVDAVAAVAADDATQVVPTAAGELTFPIDDYESLKINEIVPLLDELDLDELDLVREREEQGKNRSTLIRRIDERTAALEDEEEPATAGEPIDDAVDLEDGADVGAAAGAMALDGAASDEALPIAGYSTMTVNQILPLLDDLSDEDLETIAEHEERTRNRAGIIGRIDAIFEGAPPLVTAPAKKAPAKKATAKKAPAKKAPAKKASAAKATGVKKGAATRSPARKATAAKASAPKAAAPRKGAASTKKAGPAKRAAGATKATAKKAAKRG